MTYATEAQKPSSEKVMLAWMEPTHRAITWTLSSGAIYTRPTDFYAINVAVDTTDLTEASSSSLSAGEFFFDAPNKTLYVRMSDNTNPAANFVSVTERLFFADSPYILTHDLTVTGNEVEYDSRLKNNPTFPQGIDSAEQLGIALESAGSLTLENKDGFFEPIFDKLFWTEKRVVIYSWFPNQIISQAQKIFEGVIHNKKYNENLATFSVKDNVFKLRQPLNLGFYSSSDGDVSDDVTGTPKRRLYGQLTGVKVQSIDQTLAGFELSGTLSGVAGTKAITGAGTDFLAQCSPGDTLTVDSQKLLIEFVTSITAIVVSENIATTFSGETATNLPEVPYRGENRTHLIAGHKLREPSTTITEVDQLNRFDVASTTDLFAEDLIKIGSETRVIKRISGNTVVLTQNLESLPAVSTAVVKNPVSLVTFNKNSLVIDSDWTVTNTTSAAKLVLTVLAEFNATRSKDIRGTSATFTVSSRNVTGTGTSFLADFKPRDWIQSGDILHTTWYEILEVSDDTNLIIRVAYAGANNTSLAMKKNVTYVEDDSTVVVNCIGMENSGGEWVKTASDVVKDLLENDASITNLDTASFSDSGVEAPYRMALKLPLDKGKSVPIIRDVISICNKSVFGSLIQKNNANFAYNILNTDRPSDLAEVNDHDILGWNVETVSKVKRKVNGKYNFFDADVNTGEQGHGLIEFTNTFVDNLIGSKDVLNRDIHLFTLQDATEIVERYALVHSLTQSVIKIKAKMNFALSNINGKVWVGLDRLYQRFGSTAQKKIGIISKIKRSGQNTDIELTDLSGIFNRVANVAPDTSDDFADASEDDKIISGYIVDDDTEIPGSDEAQWGINLIG